MTETPDDPYVLPYWAQAQARDLALTLTEGTYRFDHAVTAIEERLEGRRGFNVEAQREVVAACRAALEHQQAAAALAVTELLKRSADTEARSAAVAKTIEKARALQQEEEADGDAVKVKIKAEAGWDIESLEEACYRLRCGGGEDLTKVYPSLRELTASLPFPNLMPMHPIPPPAHRISAPERPATFPNPVAPDHPLDRPRSTPAQKATAVAMTALVVCWILSFVLRAGVLG